LNVYTNSVTLWTFRKNVSTKIATTMIVHNSQVRMYSGPGKGVRKSYQSCLL